MNLMKDILQKIGGPRLVLIGVIILCILLYLLVPQVNNSINAIVAMFASGDFSQVERFIDSYGPQAAIISFLLMVFQSIIAPIPAFVITVTNANLFGWWQGAILSWSSAMVGAAVCFYIARILGRDVVEKLISKAGLKTVDEFFDKHGALSILIARLLPFMSFDWVSYGAGLTKMRFWSFFIATGIGQLPATLIYSYVGGMLTGGAKMLVTGLLILFALGALIALLAAVYRDRLKKKNESVKEL